MDNLPALKQAELVTLNLEDLLIKLCDYGRPRIFRNGYGWSCAVEMNVSLAGTTFEVRSEFDKSSPILAVRECAQRVAEALKMRG